MATGKAFNQTEMKRHNRYAVLSALRDKGPFSRICLTRMLGLDGTTITSLVRELIDEGLVISIGYEQTKGRPKQLLQLNGISREAVGIDVSPNHVLGVAVDLTGNVKATKKLTLQNSTSQKVILNKIRQVGQALLKEIPPGQRLGVGLAHHGVVNAHSGEVLQAAHLLHWKGVKLHEYISNAFAVPYSTDDTSRCKARAEFHFGAARNINNFLFIELSVGIGAVVFTDGRPQRGSSNSAGELGHCVVIKSGPQCWCGMRGCLETVASIHAIEKKYDSLTRSKHTTAYSEIARLTREGNSAAIDIITEAGRYVGMAISSLVNVLNPGNVVLCGELLEAGEVIRAAIIESMRDHTIRTSYEAMQIVEGKLGSDSAAIGAATMLLDRVFGSD